ncbi:MAG: ribonuclease HII [Alphaproteobacteria bacterium]|nr:ribonuclease HII [Alphaproteobacteria bacterium]
MLHFRFEKEEEGPVAGVDEAGRGPWAGPVVAAAVILDPARVPFGLNDSKKVSEARREALYEAIMAQALAVHYCAIEAEEIDRLNILEATMRAMAASVQALKVAPHCVLIDGNRAPPLPIRTRTLIKGDAQSLSIAAASIIAKVTRDRIMQARDAIFPDYGFARHKGYGTAQHEAALYRFGPCTEHRQSFAPVKKAALTTRCRG